MAAASSIKQAILLCLTFFPLFLQPSSAQTSCTNLTVSNGRQFASCDALPQLSSSLHWTYDAMAGTIDIAYSARQSSDGWIAWAINPTGSGMVGAQALVALQQANGTMKAWTTSVESYTPNMKEGNLSFAVDGLTAEYSSGGVMTIFAKIVLPSNGTSVNQVWQQSTSIGTNGYPTGHPTSGANVKSFGTIDLLSGSSTSTKDTKLRRKNIHGVLNVVSWGVLMPLGAMIARHMRVFESADPAWFYLHVTCQCSAYVLGVAGWGTGLKLGSESPGVTHHAHRSIGITLFCLATLQVFALLLRPKKDHKHRTIWNVYHRTVGLSAIVLGAVNIFKGFDILNPKRKWRNAYVGVLAALAAVAFLLEIVTRVVVLRRRSRKEAEKSSRSVGNGYSSQMP